MGRDHDPPLLILVLSEARDVVDQRQQISEGLAHARARLDDEFAAGVERMGDRLDHLPLLRALFITRPEPTRYGAFGPEGLAVVDGHGAIVDAARIAASVPT